MIQNVLQSIGGVGIFGIISICLFFAFFLGMLIWAARLKKPYLNAMKDLPLNSGETASSSEPENSRNPKSHHE